MMTTHHPYSPESYLQNLTSSASRRSAFHPNLAFDLWQMTLQQRFRERLGQIPLAPADLNPQVLEQTSCEGYTRERIEITTYEGLRMPLYVLIPETSKPNQIHNSTHTPAVLAIHGHGYGSREIVGLNPDGSDRQGDSGLHKDFAISLVKQGFIVVAPELLGFGDRRLPEDLAASVNELNRNSCFRISSALLMIGQSMAGYRIYETMRALDYIQTRPEVNNERIGIMGISGGGLVAGFTAALDPRITCTVVSGYVNTFAKSILSRSHCLDNYIPGILLESEMPDLLGLIAPRGLFIESGAEDHLFGTTGAHEALERLQLIFESAGRPQGIQADFFSGGHEIHGDPAFTWLREQLM